MAPMNLEDVLRLAASEDEERGITIYPLGAPGNLKISLPSFEARSIVLLHFTEHVDNIVWFWSVILAGGIPAMSPPISNIPSQRQKHLEHLFGLLDSPMCITRLALLDQFVGQDLLNPYTVESLSLIQSHENGNSTEHQNARRTSYPKDLASLMLTSGSTGNAKAVCLDQRQVLAAIAGKSTIREIPREFSALNWIGLDHVGSLIEIHLKAMYLGIEQVHVQAQDVISDPALFLNLIGRHRVGRTFAPNFFLAKLRLLLESKDVARLDQDLDLSCLRLLISGGESNVIETCGALATLLGDYGAPPNVIVPGFGMTETCAGSFYNVDCPSYDIQNGYQFASLGRCMPGLQMRVTVPGSKAELPTIASTNEPGLLELRGSVLFRGYLNNTSATNLAFSPDGWFKTGDQAFLDSAGNLNIVGRNNESININGVKHLPNELETAIEESSLEGITQNHTVCFSFRPPRAQTEQIFIVYLPSFDPDNIAARISTRDAIIQVTFFQTGSRPCVLPLNSLFLQKSTLGKLSRFKIRAALERGDYKMCEDFDRAQIMDYNSSNMSQPAHETERLLREEFCEELGLSQECSGVNTPIFDMGVSSIHLIRLKKRLQMRLSIPEIPILTMMRNLTIRSLSAALKNLNKAEEYNSVVILQPNGHKAPIWLFHPGVGEILVFLNLAKFLPDRPVYALRARGFEAGETYFANIQEAVTIYHAAIKTKQRTGPYALAGYSYGTMLAFETAKLLETNDDRVAFLGCMNLPPHIKFRMQQLDWIECLLHLSYFLGLITAEHGEMMAPRLRGHSKEQAVNYIREVANPDRLLELALSADALANWADLAYGLQSMAREYEPSGAVAVIDVFFAEPLKIVASSKEAWVKGWLSKWADFCDSEPRFHEVMGEHYTMIGETHISSFQIVFREALKTRKL
ncbi:putative non-ribosomal peptide synthase-like protein [Mollisia scopiformis]|uniref:Putative non-ribosomal peptide synthase-like protein n=1 Tax=Mollisia scopiformis TaxID=149040 RepID=A0A194WYA8_MOLSC|nr:putative non-ribosomal peptide synthase-like protein [Mollisia scopiformis]KUJ12592.1 putative non-ribosomal peptide synthase-like protein [Mollisia scopiformis]